MTADDGPNQEERGSKGHAMRALLGVANSIAVILGLGCCALIGMLPLVLVTVFMEGLDYYPAFLMASVLSAPGLAALFAIFRDQPGLASSSTRVRIRVAESMAHEGKELPDWIAPPYVDSSATSGFFTYYFKAYVHLALRSWLTWLPLGCIAFAFLYDLQIASRVSWGGFLRPPILVCLILLVQTALISLVLLVEYPKARIRRILLNALLLSVRRFYMLILALLVLVGYFWGLLKSPILVALLGTGPIWYLIWASARWQAHPFFLQMAKESHNPQIESMYQQGSGRPLSSGSSYSSLSDYKQ